MVWGINCVLDRSHRTNVGSIPFATVGTSNRLPSDMYLISCMLYGQQERYAGLTPRSLLTFLSFFLSSFPTSLLLYLPTYTYLLTYLLVLTYLPTYSPPSLPSSTIIVNYVRLSCNKLKWNLFIYLFTYLFV